MAGEPKHPIYRIGEAIVGRQRLDGWLNFLTGFGTYQRDKREHSHFARRMLSFEELSELYRGDWAAARVCDAVPDEMLRKGFEVVVANDVESSAAINKALDDMQTTPRLWEANVWGNVFGGAAILLGTDDEWSKEGGLRQPLNLDAVKSLEVLTVLDARELVPLFYYDSPFDPKYGQVKTYRAQPLFGVQSGEALREMQALFEIHESRVVRFEGTKVSRRYVQQNLGWGDSKLQRCHEIIRDSGMNWSAASALLQDFSQGVFKMKGLAEAIGADQQGLVLNRIAAMDMSRSALRSILIDAEGEEFTRTTTPITGLSEVLDKFMLLLSAAAKMPVTVLMGQSPAGLNATGASDLRLWYDSVAVQQQRVLVPAIRQICDVLFHAKNGPTKGIVPADWTIKFEPLYELDGLQEAQRRLTIAQTDDIYLKNQVTRPAEVAVSRYGGSEFSAETHLDTSTREAMAPGPDEPDPTAKASRPSPAAIDVPNPALPTAVGSAQDPRPPGPKG